MRSGPDAETTTDGNGTVRTSPEEGWVLSVTGVPDPKSGAGGGGYSGYTTTASRVPTVLSLGLGDGITDRDAPSTPPVRSRQKSHPETVVKHRRIIFTHVTTLPPPGKAVEPRSCVRWEVPPVS